MAARRPRSDSRTVQAAAFDQDQQLIPWPDDIGLPKKKKARDAVMRIFGQVISARAAEDWKDAHVILAAQLASVIFQGDKLFAILAQENFETTGMNSAGVMVTKTHHLNNAWLGLSARQTVIMTKLSLSGLPEGSHKTIRRNGAANPARVTPLKAVPGGKPVDWIKIQK